MHRGVYAVGYPAPALHAEHRWMAAVLATGADSALSHTSAGRLWGIWRGPESGTHVVAPRQRRPRAGIASHRSCSLRAGDLTRRRGIPVTGVERTIVDLADVLTVHQLANVMHEAAYRKLLNVRRLRAAIRRARGRTGLPRVESALRSYLAGSAGTRSKLEDRFFALLHAHDLEPPAVNVRVRAAGRAIEVDFFWPAHKLCVEVDGPGHRRPGTRADDAARDALLAAQGFAVVRVTASDLDRRGASVVARLRSHIGTPMAHRSLDHTSTSIAHQRTDRTSTSIAHHR